MSDEKIVKRGYVKWTDEDGVFHKEPLVDHPELLKEASAEEQLRAEEVRRLNAAAEDQVLETELEGEANYEEALTELKAAPEEVHTAAQLSEEVPASGAEEDGEKSPEVEALQEPATSPIIHPSNSHEEPLADLYQRTTEE